MTTYKLAITNKAKMSSGFETYNSKPAGDRFSYVCNIELKEFLYVLEIKTYEQKKSLIQFNKQIKNTFSVDKIIITALLIANFQGFLL